MKLYKSQLKRIIEGYLGIENKFLNEGVKGNYLLNEIIKSFDIEKDDKLALTNAISLTDEAVARIGSGTITDYITGTVGPLSKIGIFASGAVSQVAGLSAVGMATFALFNVIPTALAKTVDNLSTVEGKLRNLRESYEDINTDRAKRVKQFGMDPEDTDFDGSNASKEVAKNLGIQQYTFDDIVKHLAAESLKIDGENIRMKKDAIVFKLVSDGVISDKFLELVKEEFKRQRTEMNKIPEKFKEKFYEALLVKAKKVAGKPNAAKEAAKDFAEAGLNVVLPESKNIISIIFRVAATASVAKV